MTVVKERVFKTRSQADCLCVSLSLSPSIDVKNADILTWRPSTDIFCTFGTCHISQWKPETRTTTSQSQFHIAYSLYDLQGVRVHDHTRILMYECV